MYPARMAAGSPAFHPSSRQTTVAFAAAVEVWPDGRDPTATFVASPGRGRRVNLIVFVRTPLSTWALTSLEPNDESLRCPPIRPAA